MTFPASPQHTGHWRPFDLQEIGTGLAFTDFLPELKEALSGATIAASAVVQAPPGTGKTTLVPPLLANMAGLASAAGPGALSATGPRIVVTQPRRVAARSAARRLAALDGSRLGERVGFTVRGEHVAGPGTLIEFVTPGILIRRLLAEPGLEKVYGVILDEVHERGLETDLLLGMLTEVRQLREDLLLVAMSATLDSPRFAAVLGDKGQPAPIVDCPPALHSLDVVWTPAPAPRLGINGVTREFLDHVAVTAAAEHTQWTAREPDVDALVFVPGAREVSEVAARLRSRLGSGTEILELHGQIGPREQDRAVAGREPAGLPRIIVSTDLAESSLTVPGVRLVIDAGLSREPRRDSGRGMSGLVTVSCSQASAEQRAGRAARLGPGRVVRCYAQAAYAAAPAHRAPEIASADLTSAALVLACWGAPEGKGLALPDAPPQAAMADAVEVLRELGAVDSAGLATPTGRTLASIPADPRLARALLDGAPTAGARAAAEVVAVVSGDYRALGADLTGLLCSLRAGRHPSARPWAEEVKRLEAIAGRVNSRRTAGAPNTAEQRREGGSAQTRFDDAVGFVIALAFPDRVARRVDAAATGTYLLSSGTRAGLPVGSPLTGQDWLAVAEVARGRGRDAATTGAAIRSAAPLTAMLAEAAAGHLLRDAVEAQFAGGRVTARRERRLGAIVLSSAPVRPGPAEGRAAVGRVLALEGLRTIGWSQAADGLRRRMAFLRREVGEPWPDVAEAALLNKLEEWLSPETELLAGGAPVSAIDLAEPLRRLLPWPEAGRLAELAPEWLEVPSGSRVPIAYPDAEDDDGRPVVAVKLQECFGWAETPRLAGDRVPVLFHLLSPARRPLAVTDDLASFWSGPYAHVRAEMRGRYPKHPWPEDPWTALPTARTKARQ